MIIVPLETNQASFIGRVTRYDKEQQLCYFYLNNSFIISRFLPVNFGTWVERFYQRILDIEAEFSDPVGTIFI